MNANQKKSQLARRSIFEQLVYFSKLVQMSVAVALGGLGFDTLWPLVSKGGHYILIILFVIFMITFIVVFLHAIANYPSHD